MKKFYIPILAAAFFLVSYSSQAQVYNSISSNPSNFTFDDPRFWIGGVPPPNPCNGCTITVNANVTMAHLGNSSALPPASTVFSTQTPPGTASNDGVGPLTLGMRFQSAVPGQILGASFFKNPIMLGAHIGALYTNTGTLLASATFTGETPSGWQIQNFAAPVTITPGVTYIIAVYMADANYVGSGGDFVNGIFNGVLSGVKDQSPDPNGIYVYGTGLTFPNQNFTPGTNYWLDVNFAATPNTLLNDVVFNNSTVNVRGTVDLEVSTVTHLNGSTISMGNDPFSVENLFVNDQMFLDPASVIRLANTSTTGDVLNAAGNTLVGTYNFGAGVLPGIFTVRSASPGPAGQIDITLNQVLNSNYNGTYTTPVSPYPWNCVLGLTCSDGVVFGPTITQFDATNNFYGFAQSTVLPVVLVQLLATRNDDGSIKISWATSQEQNSGYYDVERSSDQAGWAKIGSVRAKGYSSTTTNYSYNDQLPLDGTGYYRLKMTDLDGKFTYSKAVSVSDNKNKTPLVVYSNPFNDQIRLKVNVSRAQNLVLTVSDMMGKTYLSQSYHAQSGDNFVNLVPSTVASGMYILRIHGDSYDQTVKLEKQ